MCKFICYECKNKIFFGEKFPWGTNIGSKFKEPCFCKKKIDLHEVCKSCARNMEE